MLWPLTFVFLKAFFKNQTPGKWLKLVIKSSPFVRELNIPDLIGWLKVCHCSSLQNHVLEKFRVQSHKLLRIEFKYAGSQPKDSLFLLIYFNQNLVSYMSRAKN